MAIVCSVCNSVFQKGGIKIKDGTEICPVCQRNLKAMLGDIIPIADFDAVKLRTFFKDPSSCPSTIPYYKKKSDYGCCVCGRTDIFIGNRTKDGKPLCKECIQDYVTVSSEEYYLDPSGFSSKHEASYFIDVLSDCVRPRHDIIFNFRTEKIFFMQALSNKAYKLLRFEDILSVDNGYQKYEISVSEEGRPVVRAFIKGEPVKLEKTPAFTIVSEGSGFVYDGEKANKQLKVSLRIDGNNVNYVIKDATDTRYEYEKTFGTFLRMIRCLDERAKRMEKEAEEQRRLEEERLREEAEEEARKLQEKRNAEEAAKKASEKAKREEESISSGRTILDLANLRRAAINASRNTKQDEEKKEPEKNTEEYDTLIKLRQLLDAGILTEEEFSAKKKQILGL